MRNAHTVASLAGRVRRTVEVLTEVSDELLAIGLNQQAMQCFDPMLELEKLHVDLVKMLTQVPPREHQGPRCAQRARVFY
jgi:hypothetical protein